MATRSFDGINRDEHVDPFPRPAADSAGSGGHSGERGVLSDDGVGPAAVGSPDSACESRRARERAWEFEMLARLEAQNERLHRAAATDRWAVAVSAALDDEQLSVAIRRLTRPVEGLSRRSVPAVRAALLCWASHTASDRPEVTLSEALAKCLATDLKAEAVPDRLADRAAPAPTRPADDLSARIRVLLPRLEREQEPPGHELSL